MSFTIANAITRLSTGPKNVFAAGLSSDQMLQRVNECLERMYEFGTWRGVNQTIPLTSSGGIITLPPAYQRIETPAGLKDTSNSGGLIDIKSMQWAFSKAGPGAADWTKWAGLVAIDMGDNTSGQRQYQLTNDPATNDARVLVGLCRLRYVWATDTATVVIPDSYQALRMVVYSLGREDAGQFDAAKSVFADAMAILNGNLQEFEPEDRNMTWGGTAGALQIQNII